MTKKSLLFLVFFVIIIYGCAQQAVTKPEETVEKLPEIKPEKEIPSTKTIDEPFIPSGLCEQEEWPPDCDMIPFAEGREICKKCKSMESKSIQPEPQKEIKKFIVANPIELSQIARISKFRSCVGHDYSGLNNEGEKETLRSMKHYIEPHQQLIGTKDTLKIFAPFDGKVVEVQESPPGKQLFISANAAPEWNFIFFHISPLPNIEEGTAVKAGELIGYASSLIQRNFDFGLKQFGRRGQIFESPFLHMSDDVTAEYEKYGVTPENVIIKKTQRDANPCPVEGARDGDANFPGEREEDYVKLR